MKVMLDGRSIQDHFPGIGRYAYNLALALAQAAPGLALWVLHDPSQANTRFDLGRLAGAGARLAPVAARNFSPAEQWRVPDALRQHQIDVYHSPYYVMPYRPGCAAVLTLHDLIPLRHGEAGRPVASAAFNVSVRLAVAAANHLIAVSEASARDIRETLDVPAEKVTAIPEAPDPQFAPQPEASVELTRRRLALPPKYALYFGSNKPHKNLPRLVTAYASLAAADRVPLVIAGHWDKRYPEARQRAAVRPGRVHLIGPVPQADLAALYTGAQLFVFPSLAEGFGLPVLEAMACGTPVLCADLPVLREVAGEAALYFDPRQPEAMAAGRITARHGS
jgi:glycosyltransferase involved in cell wall biosynthesis